jgi:hypothetical protein
MMETTKNIVLVCVALSGLSAGGVARRTAERVEAAVRTAARPASVVGGLLRDVIRSPTRPGRGIVVFIVWPHRGARSRA